MCVNSIVNVMTIPVHTILAVLLSYLRHQHLGRCQGGGTKGGSSWGGGGQPSRKSGKVQCDGVEVRCAWYCMSKHKQTQRWNHFTNSTITSLRKQCAISLCSIEDKCSTKFSHVKVTHLHHQDFRKSKALPQRGRASTLSLLVLK